MRKLVLAAAAALFGFPAAAEPPKLLVVISVDQFSSDLFDQYRGNFTGGLARIASGAAFRNGYQSHAATETCPGHSTILTGDHPARTGIIANHWIDQSATRSDKSIYCAEDERVPGSSSTSYTVSPEHLLVTTLGERLKAWRPGSRNVAVSGKDRAAVMMTGRHVDQRWYWTGEKFETDLKNAPVPEAATKVNTLIAATLARPRPPLDVPPVCAAHAQPIAVENSDLVVGAGRFARAAGDKDALRLSPELDGDTLALAAALVDEMQLGKRADPDVLAVSLSATDYVGHAYGTQGQEMCLQLLTLDREIGDFLAVLDSRGIDYAVALTADHGGLDIPERMRTAGTADAARVVPELAASAMGKTLASKLGLPGPGLIGEGSAGDVYLDRSLPVRDQRRLLTAAIAAYRAHPQVEAVFTAAELAATPMPTTVPDKWTLRQRARASFNRARSGDLVVVLKRDITPIATPNRLYIATHGSAWDYDRRVPVLFWRRGMARAPSDSVVDTVDIMPTLAAWLGLPVDSHSIDGHCLARVAECPPAASAPTERGH